MKNWAQISSVQSKLFTKCRSPRCHGAGQLVASSFMCHSTIHSCRIKHHPHRRISGSQGQKKSDFFGISTERKCFTTDWQSTSKHWQNTLRHWRLLTAKKRYAMNECYMTMRGNMRRKCSMMKCWKKCWLRRWGEIYFAHVKTGKLCAWL